MIGTSRSVWGFDPRSIPGCQLWLDAADPSAMTLSGSNVTQWNDKSPLATPFTLSNGSGGSTIRTTYVGLPVVQVSNSCFFNASYSYPLATRSIFFVMAETVHSDWRGLLSFTDTVGQSDYNTRNGYTITSTNTVGSNVQFSQNFGNGGFNFNYNASNGIKDVPFQLYEDVTSNTAVTLFITGSNVYSSNTSVAPLTSTGLTVGGRGGIPNSGALVIAEVLLYNTALTTSQRQQVEGYLAHKWGLTGYYDSSIPLSIPGCQLWLDGADPAATGVPPSAGTLSTWVDKSGNGRNATTAAGTPTFALTPSRVTFNGSSWYSTTLSSTPTTETIFLVSSTTNNIAGGQGQIGCTTSNFGGRGLFQTSSVMRYTSFGVANRANNVNGFVNGSIFITDVVFEGTNSQVFINGVGGTVDTTTSFSGSGTTLIGSLGGATQPFFGSIYEVIIFNAALTTTQRQTIEGYLSKKWGIGSSSSIPSTHPFSSIRPHLRTFQPIDVPGCQLWLDAADSSTITFSSGSNVSSWADKSGNGRNGTSTGSPTLSSGQIVFSGSQWFSGSITNTSANLTAFVVAKTTTSPATQHSRILSASAGGNDFDNTPSMDVMVYVDTANTLTSFRNLVTLSTVTTTPNQTFLAVTKTNATTNTFYLNGTASSTVTLSGGAVGSFGYTTYWVGSGPTGANLTGTISEVLYYHADLTTSERQQIEGYLAHKWGLSPSLPVISPLSIPGCQLWFDAADSSSMTLSGSSVTQWRDKSLNVSSTTSVAGSNVLTQNAMNGRPAILLNGSSSFTGSTTGSGTTLTVCIVATQASGCASDGGLVCFGRTGFPDWNDVGSLAITKWASNSGQMVCTRVTNSQTVNTGLSTPFIYILVFDGTFVNSYLNGTIQTPTNISRTGTFAYTQYAIGNRASPGNAFWTGFIGESIVYNTALTTSQRQQIEGYLARKWGISISATLPSPHPFKSFPPASLPFSPRNISGLALWLDGADQSSMTLSGSSVTQWNDKSGNGYNATIASGRIGATFSSVSNCVYFQASNVGYQTNYPANPTNETMFIVANVDSPSSINNNTLIGGQSGARSLGVGWSGNSDVTRCSYLNNALAWQTATPSGSYAAGTRALITGQVSSGTTQSIAMNGAAFTTATSGSAYNSSTFTYLGVDTTTNNIYYYKGFVMEIIFYNSLLSTSQRQQVEGYLAHKWGLVPPSSITPLTIPGCQLWLDGADPAGTGTLPANGATVSTWNDKSGNGKHATATGTSTYLSGGGINFTGSSYFLNQTFSQNLSQRSIFIVFQETSHSEYAGVFPIIPTPNSGNDNATVTGLSCETTSNSLTFVGIDYISRVGNASLLPKAIYYDSMNGTVGSGYLNRSNVTNVTAGYTAGTCSGYGVGGRWQSGGMSGLYRLNGVVHEILFYNRPLTNTERQTIERYLANKWGIGSSSSLPSTHPYVKLPA